MKHSVSTAPRLDRESGFRRSGPRMAAYAIPGGAAMLVALLLLAGCASSAALDEREARKVVGTEEGIRVEGELVGSSMAAGERLLITYSVTNQRPRPIAVADIVAETSYESETQVITIGLGSEVPGQQFLPRLVPIEPGETKTFKAAATLPFVSPTAAQPNALRLRVNVLSDVEPFAQLIGITEKAVFDPALADRLFPLWIERTEAVFTNAVPMRWGAVAIEPEAASRRR